MIKKCCENCIFDNVSIWENKCLNCATYKKDKIRFVDYFKPYEELVRKDEREQIILDIRKLLKDNSKTLSKESKVFSKAIIDLIKRNNK